MIRVQSTTIRKLVPFPEFYVSEDNINRLVPVEDRNNIKVPSLLSFALDLLSHLRQKENRVNSDLNTCLLFPNFSQINRYGKGSSKFDSYPRFLFFPGIPEIFYIRR